MFNIFKFKRKVKKSEFEEKNEECINFNDLNGQNLSLFVDNQKNKDILVLQDESGLFNIALNEEKAFLLSLALNEYGSNKTLVKTINTFKDKE